MQLTKRPATVAVNQDTLARALSVHLGSALIQSNPASVYSSSEQVTACVEVSVDNATVVFQLERVVTTAEGVSHVILSFPEASSEDTGLSFIIMAWDAKASGFAPQQHMYEIPEREYVTHAVAYTVLLDVIAHEAEEQFQAIGQAFLAQAATTMANPGR